MEKGGRIGEQGLTIPQRRRLSDDLWENADNDSNQILNGNFRFNRIMAFPVILRFFVLQPLRVDADLNDKK